ncbi:tetraacyldisaccharide 4'-kinase [bacterium]|nr:tetraacyldisaccharide 4'-kinase [bacterium]
MAVAARTALRIASVPYALVATLRSAAFDMGMITTERVDRPVISIGNLTTGGTGKTPMVEYVARYLREKGLRVAILSRGYGSDPEGGSNDEALMLDANLPDVPHLQGADRSALARVAIEELETEAIVLDDGHQHRRLGRDLNVVLIDATNPFGHGWPLPAGLLREPLRTGLKRADVVVLTRSDLVSADTREAIRSKVARFAPAGFVWCEGIHRPIEAIDFDGTVHEPGWLAGKEVALFCGLGNPDAFRATVEQLGALVRDVRWFPDHHRYSQNDIAELSRWVAASGAQLALTTQKDSVKLPVESLGGRHLLALRIGMVFVSGEKDFQRILDATVCPRPND